MAQAFRCDRCGEYEDGEPERRQLRHVPGRVWKAMAEGELCEGCADELDDRTREFLGFDDDGDDGDDE